MARGLSGGRASATRVAQSHDEPPGAPHDLASGRAGALVFDLLPGVAGGWSRGLPAGQPCEQSRDKTGGMPGGGGRGRKAVHALDFN